MTLVRFISLYFRFRSLQKQAAVFDSRLNCFHIKNGIKASWAVCFSWLFLQPNWGKGILSCFLQPLFFFFFFSTPHNYGVRASYLPAKQGMRFFCCLPLTLVFTSKLLYGYLNWAVFNNRLFSRQEQGTVTFSCFPRPFVFISQMGWNGDLNCFP